MAVAVLDRMAVPAGSTPADAAREFAKVLHELWGVGHAACSDGVLLLLAVGDRQVYVSTGAGSQPALPDAAAARVVDLMKPQLREGDFGGAVEQGVTDIGLALAGRGLPEPEGGEGWNWFGLLFFGGIAAMLGGQGWKAWRRRRQYRDCKVGGWQKVGVGA